MNSIKRVASSTPVTAAEMLKQFKQKDTPVSGVMGLKLGWKRNQPENLGFQKELTAKEVGQLKHVHKALGDQAQEVMVWALANWSTFTAEVGAMKGLAGVPSIPHVGFFSAHYEVAVNQMSKPKAVVQSIAVPKQVVVEKVQEVVHTPQQSDYLDVMAQLEKLTGKP